MDEKDQDSASQTTPPDKQKPQHSKNALLRYLTILFAFAFLLVLLSYLIQMRNMNTTVSELNKTSSSALSNAEQLQATNQMLMEDNDTLSEQINTLSDRVAELERELDDATDDASAAASLSDERIAELETALRAQQETYESTLAAYELLARAGTAHDAGDLAALRESITSLGSQTQFLSAEGVARYQALSEAMNTATAESGNGTESGAE